MLGPEESGRHKAPRERRRRPRKGFQSARPEAGAHPRQAVMETLQYLKAENLLVVQEKTQEM
jgi:hypothetical protein